jgi:hypothetical protein
MKKIISSALLSGIVFLASSCASYKFPTERYYEPSKIKFAQHPIYEIVPRKFEQIKAYDLMHLSTWLLFGNEWDGVFGEAYPEPFFAEPSYSNAFKWSILRNPLTNVKNYIIGTSYFENHNNFSIISIDRKRGWRVMKRENDPTVFGTGPNTFQLQLNDIFPYVSFKVRLTDTRKFDFGIGWKHRGNFGLKLRPFAERDFEDF